MKNYKEINLDTYIRKDHFEYFNSLTYPYVGVTVNVDITKLFERTQNNSLPFFLTLCHLVANAANSVTELKHRIINNKIVEYESCMTSHTVAIEDGTYAYCNLDHSLNYEEYIDYAIEVQEKTIENKNLVDAEDVKDELIFISSLPWLSYTSMVNPVPIPADSNPRITWGKYYEENDKILLPVSLLCNHAIVDGVHLAKFYEELDNQIESFYSK